MGHFTYLKDSDNVFKQASLVPIGDELTGYPSSNVIQLPISKVCRLRGIWNKGWYVSLPQPAQVQLIAVCGHNLNESSYLLHCMGSTTAPADGTQFSVGIPLSKYTSFLLLQTPVTFKYWAFSLYDPQSHDGYMQAGYLMAGMPTTLPFCFNQGWEFTQNYFNTRIQTPWGRRFVEKGYRTRSGRVDFDPLMPAESKIIRDLHQALDGDVTPMFWIPNSDVHEGWFGRCVSNIEETRGNRFATGFDFEEDSPGKYIRQPEIFMYNAGDDLVKVGGVFSRAAGVYPYQMGYDGVLHPGWSDPAGTVSILRDQHFATQTDHTTLLERAMINWIVWSEEIANAAWLKNALTVVTNATYAPNTVVPPGAQLVADKICEDAANTVHAIRQEVPAVAPASKTVALSFFAHAAERTWIEVFTYGNDSVGRRSWINLADGTVGTKDAGHTIRVYPMANGWYRVTLLWNLGPGANTTRFFHIEIAPSDAVVSYAGTAGWGLYLWGVQQEVFTDVTEIKDASSYFGCAATALTRPADSLYFVLPTPLDVPAMTIYLSFIERAPTGTFGFGPFCFLSGAAGNWPRIWVDKQPGGGGECYRVVRGTALPAALLSASAVATPAQIDDWVELRIQMNEAGAVQLHQTLNGGVEEIAAIGVDVGMEWVWNDVRIYLGTAFSNLSAYATHVAFKSVKIARGLQDRAFMRALKQ